MAEAEDVITDAARHATVFVQDLWRRHRRQSGARQVELADVAGRLDLLVNAVFGRDFRLRPAHPPAPRTWLDKMLRRQEAAPTALALPATDGAGIWLPRRFDIVESDDSAIERYRIMCLQQAMRAVRGSAQHYPFGSSGALQACYQILEARAADEALARILPGMGPSLQRCRALALTARPALRTLPAALRPFETMLRAALASDSAEAPLGSAAVLALAQEHAAALAQEPRQVRGRVLVKDGWLGEFIAPPAPAASSFEAGKGTDAAKAPPRVGRLARRPRVREAVEGEDDPAPQGATMVPTAQPHEQAEDAMGIQRPTDRDTDTAADEFADALSELPEARLVMSATPAPEVLLSDDPPDSQARNRARGPHTPDAEANNYPEWDWKSSTYIDPGATVWVHTALAGSQATVDAILLRQAPLLLAIRRHFELLRAQPTRLRQQLDGDDIDMQAWIDNQAQLKAGGSLDQRLYQTQRRARRDMAVTLLVDISGSTDGWVSGQCRVIDVEREALLMVCVALQGLGEPFSVLGFSGEGPGGVVVRTIKRFEEPYDNSIALRIAGLEPENYTRAGAALRHATFELMTQGAEHKLLIVLSDGKPNDVDQYDGRYGVEDLRQAVVEARLQGISPFCLTVDRQGAAYLPAVFGENAYALIHRAELLPGALLGWLRKLVAA